MAEGKLTLGANSLAAGASLHWHSWLPKTPPRAIILLAHGYAEHLGRYQHVAAHLNDQGFGVFALDHWGHGRSDGSPGFVPKFSVFTDGVEALLSEIEATHPDLPLFLIGHSMGGLIAATHLLTHQSHYRGAILSGPAIMPAETPSSLILFVSRFLSCLFPKTGVLKLDANGVSRDPAVVAAYLADPLVYTGKIGARLAAEFFDAMAHVRARAQEIKLPLLLAHGDQDSLAAPSGSQYLFDHCRSTDKTLRLYEGLFHEIFNEPERAMVLGEVTDWIETRMPSNVVRN